MMVFKIATRWAADMAERPINNKEHFLCLPPPTVHSQAVTMVALSSYAEHRDLHLP